VSPPLAPWSRRILELLADGAWHDREELITAAMATVPPGMAFRRGEILRRCQLANPDQPRSRGGRDTAIATGRRTYARDAIHSMIGVGRIIRDGNKVRAVL
jgi:hypothetical protein